MRKFLSLFLMLCLSVPLMAQKAKHVQAEYKYISDNRDESLKQAEEKAFFRARCQAIADKFGATISGMTEIETSNQNGQTAVSFIERGGTKLRAEWLKTTKEEVIGRSVTNDGFMIITVYVEGEAREITSAGVDFEYHILRNGNRLENEDDRFKNGDHICLMFKSPVDGYLAIYLTDDERAYCMLPYKEQTDGIYRIKANQLYVFFSKDDACVEEAGYDLNLQLVTNKHLEKNTLFTIFSKEPFTKKTDNEGERISAGLVLARNINKHSFEDWLYKCQSRDVSMRVEKKEITISGN